MAHVGSQRHRKKKKRKEILKIKAIYSSEHVLPSWYLVGLLICDDHSVLNNNWVGLHRRQVASHVEDSI